MTPFSQSDSRVGAVFGVKENTGFAEDQPLFLEEVSGDSAVYMPQAIRRQTHQRLSKTTNIHVDEKGGR